MSTSAQTPLKPRFQPLAGNAPAALPPVLRRSLTLGIPSLRLGTRQSLKACYRRLLPEVDTNGHCRAPTKICGSLTENSCKLGITWELRITRK
ncbi:hypothetical protein [Nostoc sp.]|uniref:hypothetical protein n=1 Tax=Nostoc sp. TaxID=1180 RepID=UPI002FF8D564